MPKKNVPEYNSNLRKNIIRVPKIIREKTSGINIFGKTIHSILFSTDVAIIKNSNADAIIAVYPFTPHPVITQSILFSSKILSRSINFRCSSFMWSRRRCNQRIALSKYCSSRRISRSSCSRIKCSGKRWNNFACKKNCWYSCDLFFDIEKF